MAIISKIKVLGTLYTLQDASAIHSASELVNNFDAKGAAATAESNAKAYTDQKIEGLGSFLTFKGTKTNEAAVKAITSAKIGDVYLTTEDHKEWVATKNISAADASAWEMFGFDISAASATHTHNVTVTGTNQASTVTGKVTVPTVSKVDKYAHAAASGTAVGADGTATFVKSYPGATSKMVTGSVTGVSASSSATASKATAGTALSIPNVTNRGSAATWAFSVDTDGTLNISGANGSAPTLGTAFSVTPYTFADVTVPIADSAPTTFATGGLAANGGGASVMTGLGTAVTANGLTGVKVTAQPTISITEVTTPAAGDLSYVSSVSIGTTQVNLDTGSAAAQKWTQSTGSTGQPIG